MANTKKRINIKYTATTAKANIQRVLPVALDPSSLTVISFN